MKSIEHTNTYATLIEALKNPCIINSTRRAAVAIVLRNVPGTPTLSEGFTKHSEVLLIQRARNPRDPYSAHIAFPGGRQDATDESDLHTAIREVREEVGMNLDDASRFKLIGRLNDRPIFGKLSRQRNHDGTRNDYVLSAFVFVQICKDVPISPMDLQQNEVSSTFWVSLDYLHRKSSTVTTHQMRSKRPDSQHTSLFGRAKYYFLCMLGLCDLRMPAVNVLSVALDRVYATTPPDGPPVPHVMLWGLTLSCVGDIVTQLQMRRVDWPLFLPEGRLLGAFFWFSAELWFLVSQNLKRLRIAKNTIAVIAN